jgi:uncharacterized protein YbjT (DUF2867 family)
MKNRDGLILVTGASGRTGRAIIGSLKGREVKVRAFVRREEVCTELKEIGADEIVVGDLFDDQALETAVINCDQVIHICPPMNPNEATLAIKITDLCLKHNVHRLVLYSVLHPILSEVRHHSLKLQAEEYLVNSGQNYTILQPGRYMQHHELIWGEIIETGKHRMPFNVNSKFNIVDLADLAEAAANVLVSGDHEFATYQLAGPEALSQMDMAKIISEVIGIPIFAEAKAVDEYINAAKKIGMPADRIEQLSIMNEHYDKHGLRGNSNILEWLIKRPPTNFFTFIRNNFNTHI